MGSYSQPTPGFRCFQEHLFQTHSGDQHTAVKSKVAWVLRLYGGSTGVHPPMPHSDLSKGGLQSLRTLASEVSWDGSNSPHVQGILIAG